MTSQEAADRLIDAEAQASTHLACARAALVWSCITLVAYFSSDRSLSSPGMVVWCLGLFAAIPSVIFLLGRSGPPTARILMAIALAIWLTGPVARLLAFLATKT